MAARIAQWAYCALLLLVGGYLAVRGFELISLGGSWYYALTGTAIAAAAVLTAIGNKWGPRVYGVMLGLTVVWALFEAQFDLLALLPRLAFLLGLGLWFLMPWSSAAMKGKDGAPAPSALPWVGSSVGAAALALVIASFQGYSVEQGTKNPAPTDRPAITDWQHYGGTTLGSRFGEIEQININNVGQLEKVWEYRTRVPYDFKDTPQEADGLVYICTAGNTVAALDADTGQEKWRYDPKSNVPGTRNGDLRTASTFARTCRGLAYHAAPADYVGDCSKRIITNTTDERIIALDAQTGAPCKSFGFDGIVSLKAGMGPHPNGNSMTTSAPLIAGDKIVVGGWVTDNQQLGNVSGVIRAFNLVTGQFAWAWDLGNPGQNGMPDEGGEFTRGTPNSWTNMSYDPKLNLVYASTGNSSPDYFDGDLRTELSEEYASSVVAIDGATGAPKWHFQTVHRDIWDYDVPSQPVLVDITRDGRKVPTVVVPTKRGELFLLNRADGSPIYPIEERPAPQNPEAGEKVTATQPFSPLPHFRDDRLERDMWGITPLDQLYCRIAYKKLRYEGHFTPPMRASGKIEGTFQYPGNIGGFNWSSVSVDADNGLVVVSPMLMGNKITLMNADERKAAAERARQRRLAQGGQAGGQRPGGGASPAAAGQAPRGPGGAPPPGNPEESARQQAQAFAAPQGFDQSKVLYTAATAPFMSEWKIPLTSIETQVPCFEPPWGVIGVIDLNTNKLLWKRPFGSMKKSGPFAIQTGLPFNVGTPILGGPLTTRGGLIFHAGAMDATIRAFDLRSGQIKWSAGLPGSAHATPITYISPKTGKQYIVITVPNPPWLYPRAQTGSETPLDDRGGWVIAYALKEGGK